MNNKIITVFGSALTGFLILAIYIFKRIVPLTDVYLGSDRITHAKVVFIFGFIGIVILYLLRNFVKQKWIKNAGYGISFLFMAVLPVMIFISQAGSFRGFPWAIKTLAIGLIPIMFVYAAYLVYINMRIESLVLALVFAAFSVYHIILLLKVLPGISKAFSSTSISDILILLVLISYGAFFAFFSLRSFKTWEKR